MLVFLIVGEFCYNDLMSKKWFFFSVSAFFFIQFIIFSFLVHKDLFTKLDFNTTVVIQNHISRRLDAPFSILSDIGRFEVVLVFLIIFFLIIRRWGTAFVTFSLFGIFHFIELFGKYFVNHPPPMQFMIRSQQLPGFPAFTVRSEYSYPSGHAGRALFITTVMLIMIWQTDRFSQKTKIILTLCLAVYDAVMIFSRVVLGEHWTTDVVGGSLLGAALGALVGVIYEPKRKKEHHAEAEHSKKKSLLPKYRLKLVKEE